MSRKRWYKLWEKSHGFNIENDRLKHKCFIYSSPTRINQYGYQSGNLKSEIISDTISRYARINDYNVLNPTLFDNLCKSIALYACRAADIRYNWKLRQQFPKLLKYCKKYNVH